ncbi:AhpC/TSA family protein [Parapedobacter sp. SGR-10]|uniref:TlpA family protein disulfide reductase n=1 Tax=Parapedobacter sp. SGR-10 TaxID=2710879 RepID=UPI0013D48304|nr:TlpA disulfide reductase family protein [Parapedobacter sp. SGR-10]NGF58102.1 AhpC/TSA family protein [Parapedobacter sp. SGR-10]
MRTIQYLFLFLILPLFFACGGADKIVVEGKVSNPGNVKVVAFYEGDRKLDSVYLSDRDRFKFEREATQPRLLSIEIGKNKYPVIISPGEVLIFSTDLMSDPEQYEVSGSDLSIALKEFTPLRQKKTAVEDSLQADFLRQIVDKPEKEIDNLRAEYLSSYKESLRFYTDEAVAFANRQPNLAGFYAMSTLDPELAEQELIQYSEQIKDQFLDNRTVSQFKEEIEKLKKLAVGQSAPEIIAYTPNNKTVKLSDFRDKYTLVDFWASWCMPCRKENPNLVRLYQRYKNKGFDILGVSLDDNPGSWMKAIGDDGLVWTNISDLKAWSSEVVLDYRIKGIPASVLVDPEGKILAKNLRGKELDVFLQTVFE